MKYTAKKTEFIDSKFVSDGTEAKFTDDVSLGRFMIDCMAQFAKTSHKKEFDAYIDGKKAGLYDIMRLINSTNSAPSEFQVREVADRLDIDYLLITVSKA